MGGWRDGGTEGRRDGGREGEGRESVNNGGCLLYTSPSPRD